MARHYLTGFTSAGLYRKKDSGEKAGVKHIYISPHADDVALSCGGQIISNPDARVDTLVLNIFSSVGDEADQGALFDSINSQRAKEDESAWESIGVECANAGLPEALIRKKFPFRILPVSRPEGIADTLHQFLDGQARSNPDAAFYFPAGIGNHIDHLACKDAAFRLLDDGRLARIFLYEDLPYCWLRFIRRQYYDALARSVEFDEAGLGEASRGGGITLAEYLFGRSVPFPRGKKLFSLVYASAGATALTQSSRNLTKAYRAKVRTIALDDGQLEKKTRLIEHYHSQLPMLFGADPESVLRRFHPSYAREILIEIERIDPPGSSSD